MSVRIKKCNLLILSIIVNISDSHCWFTSINLPDFPKVVNSLVENHNRIDLNNLPKPPFEIFRMIFPGTKWCGPGNIANDYNDIGVLQEIDKCCRAHDNCPDYIIGDSSAHGLFNQAFFTKLDCECDAKFMQCLLNAEGNEAQALGKIYFDIIPTQCFRLDYPIVKCIKFRGFMNEKCDVYELDKTKPKIYQWFDVPKFGNFTD